MTTRVVLKPLVNAARQHASPPCSTSCQDEHGECWICLGDDVEFSIVSLQCSCRRFAHPACAHRWYMTKQSRTCETCTARVVLPPMTPADSLAFDELRNHSAEAPPPASTPSQLHRPYSAFEMYRSAQSCCGSLIILGAIVFIIIIAFTGKPMFSGH